MKGDMPVAELVRELWAYSTHSKCADQEDGWRAVMQRNAVSKSWFARSVRPLVWGLYPEDRLAVIRRALQKVFQT